MILNVEGLSKSFAGKRVVNNISFDVHAGDVYGFLGPNGAGKTTTIKMILGLLHNDEGEVYINGYSVKKNFLKAIQNVGAIVEVPQFYNYLTGYQNLKLIANLHPEVTEARIREVLNLVSLVEPANDKVKSYSLGMRQRLGIARALLHNPKLVILDEPTNGLDPQGILEIRKLITDLAEEMNLTFFISTHLLHEVEQMCNKVAILKKGNIIAKGLVRELLDRENEIVKVVVPEADTDRLWQLIQEAQFVKSLDKLSDGVKVELSKDYSGKLMRFLISQNIDVRYLIPLNPSLEVYFINLMEGGDESVEVN